MSGLQTINVRANVSVLRLAARSQSVIHVWSEKELLRLTFTWSVRGSILKMSLSSRGIMLSVLRQGLCTDRTVGGSVC